LLAKKPVSTTLLGLVVVVVVIEYPHDYAHDNVNVSDGDTKAAAEVVRDWRSK
jgi:hypothetical protein